MNKIENNKLIIETTNKGAELINIYSKTENKELLWNGDSKFWGRHSPILFPIVGRLKDNETIIDSKLYNMSQHGFARDMEFDLIDKSTNSITYILKSCSKTKSVYPYDFELTIKYTLVDTTINIDWKVFNKSNKDMYFSIGAHPAFNIPFYDNESINDYFLKFECSKDINNYTLEGPFVSKKSEVKSIDILNLTPELFKNDALIYDNINKISICSKNNTSSIDIKFESFPFVGIWSPYYKESNSIAPFLCIEPWYGIADSIDSTKIFKDKLGINKLPNKETFIASYSITINQ
ncbi:glycoside hydrolase-type carbohydrate-binding protein [[Clostridium] sordellii]|uniref:Glycoside hydrolase-type carbohydrate-binding protein n=1 Tax=Paraclostridium sordellii TaxID=1505 RepID=A0ABM9RJW2_PARSO|nr:aldose 1-epimerase family protein [Paeniclostridium sordellii]EPZ53422.1 aldose 1-epimerase family protein [[Clostridium] sordellii ATCC 9714] [Paeniclostridium sordellii ATCC 9714]CEJ72282.1 putative glycoside hydrolase-type carbohydrate-binding protein [[Clostridium] sordellii] [Paeniclostridium sordellii]CEN71183.1 glycoside hydrolase-type carbohydrate-binding protein [[Clostridium] sordellii] [Paeniclostridium sordellii]CEN74474.1 glycoside hydrolase-type carbohydrate-binding protein [[C